MASRLAELVHGLQGGDGRGRVEALGARRRAALDHPAPVQLVPPLRQRLDPLLAVVIAASSYPLPNESLELDTRRSPQKQKIVLLRYLSETQR